jgi:hypothetical protein
MAVTGNKVGLSVGAFFGINKETTYGSQVGPDSNTEWFHILSESIGLQRDLLVPPAIDSAHLDVNTVYLGREVVTGDVEMAVPYEGLENLFLHMCGEVASTSTLDSGGLAYYFDTTPSARYRNTTSPSLSIHISRGEVEGSTNKGIFSYSGCVVDSFEFSGGQNDAMRLRVTFFGKDEVFSQANNPTVAFPSSPIANGIETSVIWGASKTLTATEYTVSVSRGIDRERFFLGNTNTDEPPMSQYAVSATCTVEWDNISDATWGGNTLLEDAQALSTRIFSVNAASSTNASYGGPWRVSLVLPQAKIAPVTPNVSAAGRITLPLTLTGYDDGNAVAPYDFRIFRQGEAAFTDS